MSYKCKADDLKPTEEEKVQKRGGTMTTEAEIRLISHKSKDDKRGQKLEEAKDVFSSRASRENVALLTFGFQISKL